MPRKYSRELSYFDSRDDKRQNIGCHVKLPFPDGKYKQTWYSFICNGDGPAETQRAVKTKVWGKLADDITLKTLMTEIDNMKDLKNIEVSRTSISPLMQANL